MNQPPFELSVERHIAASPQTVWQIMTERTSEWWCPKPWRVEIVEQDWRAGGRSAMIMRGPEGEEMPMEGIFLDVVPQQRFIFTDAMTAEWQPHDAFMIGGFEIAPGDKGGTQYRAWARHWTEEAMKQHLEMGFKDGWSTVADQLAALAESEAS